jgi:uncharacterized protein YjbI with pentapeptide repeats
MPQARRHAAAAMAALVAGRQPAEVGFDAIDGRVDLRGLVVPEPAELRRWATMGMGLVALERVSDSINLSITGLTRVDFSHGFIPHLHFRGAGLVDCRFDAARLPDLRTRDSIFKGCSFEGADLSGAALGPGTRFESCDFRSARLRAVQGDGAAFSGCDFAEAELLEDDFNRCQFLGCHFAGLVQEVCFRAESWHVDEVTRRLKPPDPDGITNCDFTQARLRSVSFEHLNLKNVRFPDDDEHLALADLRCVLLRLQRQVVGDDSRAARQLSLRIEQQLGALPRSRSHGYLSLADMTESASRGEAEMVVGWIQEAATACAKREGGWLSRL